MKVKDLERTANVAWSPKSQIPVYLAAGTAAQQLDASFNTTSTLEIYSLNLSEPGLDLLLKSSTSSDNRFHKIIWGEHNNGLIVGGCDGGIIQIYNSNKLLQGESGLIHKQDKHSGHVHTLDFNPFQHNLLASGAGESEIFIWDLNNVTTPMSPGAKSQPFEDVLSLSWNRQVQHILASTFSTKCVIWDLRKEHPIIKLTDTVSRVRWKVVAWHPEIATQLCLASEEDHSPIIQLWDLRFATAPLKTLENHQRGILAMAWCNQDPDLLITCGKDDRILCWNPNSNCQNGEVLSEIVKTNQWSFDVQWCPRNPAIVACPNFDGHVSIYSLMGGKTQQFQTTNKIADSFPGMENNYLPTPQLQQTSNTVQTSVDLSRPPNWLKRPIGASFGFGGKLICFEKNQKIITIKQLVTEPELIQKCIELEQALETGNFIDYCKSKADSTDDQHKKYIWHFLKANFEENSRAELLNLLGYQIDDVNLKLDQHIGKKLISNNLDNLTEQMNNLNRIDSLDPFDSISQNISNIIKSQPKPFNIKTGDDNEGLITQALMLGNISAAVELCLKTKRFADAIIIAMTGDSNLLARTQQIYLEQCDGYVSSLISALVSENWNSVINNCDLTSWKEALVATLTHSNNDTLPLLCEQLGDRLASNPEFIKDSQLCYICAGSFDKLVNSWTNNAMTSTKDLQELIELVNLLQKSIERQGRVVKITGALANLYTHYASLLASQGKLDTALNYLGESQDEKIIALKDRLNISLGHKSTQFNQRSSLSDSINRRSSQKMYSNIPSYQPIIPVQTSQYNNTGLPPSMSQNYSTLSATQAPMTPSSNPLSPPPPPPPPRPTSVGSNISTTGTTGIGLPSKKYVLDPSVTSNPYGSNTTMMGKTYSTSYTSPSSSNFTSNALTNSSTTNTSFTPNYNNNCLPNNNLPPYLNNSNNNKMNIINQTSGYGNGTINSGGTMGYMPPPPPTTIQPSILEKSSYASGWNDPPALNKIPQPNNDNIMSARHAGTKLWERIIQPKLAMENQPITHPLYGGVQQSSQESQIFQPSPVVPTMSNNYPGGAPMNNTNNNLFNLQPIPYSGPQHQPQQQQQQQQQYTTHQEPVEQFPVKLPIPDEHKDIQIIFDKLKIRCGYAAGNPQIVRKLDEVGKKLENLYDLIRQNKLSSNTLSSLHQLVQCIQNEDYNGGLNLHTQLVSGPDFSQIATFMPGIKVLIQIAIQLQVYCR